MKNEGKLQGYKIVGVLNPEDFSTYRPKVDIEIESIHEKVSLDKYRGHFYDLNKNGKYVPPKNDICSLNLTNSDVMRVHNLPAHVVISLAKIDDLPDAIPFVKERLHQANLSYTEAKRVQAEKQAREEAERQRQLAIIEQVDQQIRKGQ